MCYVDRGIQNFKTSGILLFTPGTIFFIFFFKQFCFLNSIINRRLKLDTISAIIKTLQNADPKTKYFYICSTEYQPFFTSGYKCPLVVDKIYLTLRGKRKYIQKLLGTLILQVKCTHRNLRLYTFLVLEKYTPSPT